MPETEKKLTPRRRKQAAFILKDLVRITDRLWKRMRALEHIIGERDGIADFVDAVTSGVDSPAQIAGLSGEKLLAELLKE